MHTYDTLGTCLILSELMQGTSLVCLGMEALLQGGSAGLAGLAGLASVSPPQYF